MSALIGAVIGWAFGFAATLGIVLGLHVHGTAGPLLIGLACGYGFWTLGLIAGRSR